MEFASSLPIRRPTPSSKRSAWSPLVAHDGKQTDEKQTDEWNGGSNGGALRRSVRVREPRQHGSVLLPKRPRHLWRSISLRARPEAARATHAEGRRQGADRPARGDDGPA